MIKRGNNPSTTQLRLVKIMTRCNLVVCNSTKVPLSELSNGLNIISRIDRQVRYETLQKTHDTKFNTMFFAGLAWYVQKNVFKKFPCILKLISC